MNGWQDFGIKYYLVGNAIVWWMGSASLVVWVFTLLWHLMRFQRKINDFAPGTSSLSFELEYEKGTTSDWYEDCMGVQVNGITFCIYPKSLSEVGLSIIVRYFSFHFSHIEVHLADSISTSIQFLS